MKRVLWPAMVAGSFFTAGAAQAATETTTMPVTITIAASCTVSAQTMDFSSNQLIDITSNIDAQADITVSCTKDQAYWVSLDAGLNDGGSGITARKMLKGSDTINYQLYRDSGRTQVWGLTNGGTPDVVSDTGDGGNKTHTVYGRVPSGQANPAVGTYNDTITVTVNY
jgi:spore coat protein U-like protein